MNAEFTGERVIPGQVEVDLWNEHFSRYAFASRFAAGKRVLDAGCGAGYGSAELGRVAASVVGIDLAQDAVAFAAAEYVSPRYAQASCVELPFADASFDLVVMFEVIEHVAAWQKVLQETRRVLAAGGQLVVSTPNKSFYARTREQSGPNPYHEHEFEYTEFRDALSEVFPHVTMFLEDHTGAVLFRPVTQAASAEARIEATDAAPEDSSFFVAVCGDLAPAAPPVFVYVPSSSNLLRERLLHIERLEHEVRTKDGWISEQQTEHQELLRQHTEQLAELEKSNRWAAEIASELDQARERINALHDEHARQVREMAVGYEAQIAALAATVEERTKWAQDTEHRLSADLAACAADRDRQTRELAACVELLHSTESTLEERTRWALELNEQKARLEAALGAARASRWIRLGRVIGLGPELQGH